MIAWLALMGAGFLLMPVSEARWLPSTASLIVDLVALGLTIAGVTVLLVRLAQRPSRD